MEKGFSPIVAVILILLISLALVVLLVLWLPKVSFDIFPQQAFNQTFYRIRSCLSLDQVYGLLGFAIIKNCGATPLSDFKFHFGTSIIDLGLANLDPQQSATFYYLPIPAGSYEVFVTSNYAETPSMWIDVPRYECIGTQPPEPEDWYVNDNTTCVCSYGSSIVVEGLFVEGNGNFSLGRCLLYFSNSPNPKMRSKDNATVRIYNSTIDSDDYWKSLSFEGNSTNYLDYSNIINHFYLQQASNNIFSNSELDSYGIDSNIFHNLSITNFFGDSYTFSTDSPMTKYVKADGSNFTINFTNVIFNYVNFGIGDNSNTTLNNSIFGTFLINSELPHNLTINNWGWCQNDHYFDNYFKAEGSNFTFNGTHIFAWRTDFTADGGSNNTIINTCISGFYISWDQYSTNKFINFSSGGSWYLDGINFTMNFIDSYLYSNDAIHINPRTFSTWNFSNTTMKDKSLAFYYGNTAFFGNITFLGNNRVDSFSSSANVTRYFPTIIKDSGNYPFPIIQPARINITDNKNQSVWQGSVGGGTNPMTYYIEDPKILFNSSNYRPGNFIMKTSQVCENSTNIHVLSNTSLEFTLSRAFNYNGSVFNTQSGAVGLAFDNAYFWVASSNGNVYKYDKTGNYINSYPSGFNGLRDVASNGTHIWLLEYEASDKRVVEYKIDGSGAPVSDGWSFGISAIGEAYAVDFDGENFWVLNGSSVYKYDKLGSYTGFSFNLDRIETPLSYPDIVSSNGNIWILADTYSQPKGRGVFRYKTNGNYDNWYFDISPTTNSGRGLAYNGTYFWVMNSTGSVFRYGLNRNCLEVMKKCDEFITFLPYTINKNNTRYCLLYGLYIPNKNATVFADRIKNSSLDCLGYNIDGNNIFNTYGIYLTGSNTKNNIVKGCNITNFYWGVYLYNGPNNNTVTNNIITTSGTNGYGIYLSGGDKYNTISNNIVTTSGDSGHGIRIESSDNNTISNNTVTTSGSGGQAICFYSSYNCTISNNTVTTSGYAGLGIYLYASRDDTLFNNIITTSGTNGYGMYFYDSVNNSITGGSIISKSSYDYGLHNALTTNNFANTNFTAARKIYFDDTTSWFNYNNVSTLTFGKTNIGGTSKSCYFGDTHLGKFTLNEDGTVTKITAYISGAWGNPATVRAGIYSDSAGSPSRVKGTTSNTVVSATAGWYNFTFSTPLSLTAGTYHIGFYSGDNDMVCYYDTGSTGQYNYNNWRDFRDPYPGGSTQNWDISVYATYTSGISTTSDIWLKTNVSAAATITRKLIRWNQYLMKWNDTSDSDITARYNLTGLALNEIYYVYNNSIRAYTLNSGPSGSLSFTIVLPQNQEREIKVKGICDYYIFSSDLPYTIAQNNSLYCAAENLYISGSNATIFASSIKNSTLDCKGKEIDSNDVTNTFGVYMRINTRNNTLKNCNISDFDTGIKLQNSYNNTIIKNVIYSNTNNIDFSYSVNNTISDNNLTQTPQENVYLWDSDKNIIENNIISESDNDGISFTAGSDENIMRNNTVINVNHGICITGGTSNKFYNNTIKWTTQMSNSRGFNLAGGSSIIENNTVSGVDAWGSSGIYLTGSNTRNNTIKNNNVSDFQYGIYSENGANNNTISSNTINSSTTYGIYLVLSSNDTLINNTINNSGNVGINFVSSYNNTITNSIITNSAWSGIYFYSSSNNSLTNNTANNNYNGIVFESTSNNNQLITNIVNNNNYVGITIMSSYNNSITGGSVSFSSLSDYFLQSVGTTNNFTNTNFTVGKSIYFYETTSWFNYNNETTGNIWLKTNVSSNYEHIKRKLIKWSQTLISWNDTSDDSTITARYNITGLALSTNYNIYNNSILAYPNQNSGPSGSLSFTIYLPVNEEHNITVTT